MKLKLLFFLPVLIIASCNTDDAIINSSDNTISEGLIASRQYDSAIYYADQSLSKNLYDDQNYYSHYLLGYSYSKKNNYSLSISNYLSALNKIPDNEIYDLNRAKILKNLGRIAKIYQSFDNSIIYYKESLKYYPENDKSGLLYNLGNAYKNNGQAIESLKAYQKGLELAVQHNDYSRQAKLNNHIGLLHSKLGDYEKAREILYGVITGESYLENSKYSGKAYHVIANDYLSEGNKEKAIENFELALEHHTNDVNRFVSNLDLGGLYINEGQIEKGLIYLNKAESLFNGLNPNPEFNEVYHLIANVHFIKGDHVSYKKYMESYSSELKQFIIDKDEIIKQLNKRQFDNLVNNHNTVTDFAEEVLTLRNVILSITSLLIISIMIYFIKRYRVKSKFKNLAPEK